MEPFRGQNESRPVTDPKIGNRATRLDGSGGPIRPVAYGGSSACGEDAIQLASLHSPRAGGRLLSSGYSGPPSIAVVAMFVRRSASRPASSSGSSVQPWATISKPARTMARAPVSDSSGRAMRR